MTRLQHIKHALFEKHSRLQERLKLNKFAKDEEGAVAVIFAAVLLPLILLVGAGIDYSRATFDRSQAQDALDAAALAAVSKVSFQTDDEIKAQIRAHMGANLPKSVNVTASLIEIERNPNKIKAWIDGSTEMYLMKLAHMNSLDFKIHTEAVSSDKALEVALVLDNSGSMSGGRITALKSAAKSLVQILHDNQQSSEDLKIAVVPFNHLVRMPEGYSKKKWLDQKAKSSIHRNNLPPKANRFKLLKKINNPWTNKPEEWGGCVEARPHPLDIQDTAPTKSKGDSYFVPYFYPDSNDSLYSSVRYNSYYAGLNDYVSNSFASGMKNGVKKVFGYYFKKTLPTNGRGPNYNCFVKRILPLTKDTETVKSHIQSMTTGGYTNIHMGTIWGLRALSSHAPLEGGAPYSDKKTLKFLIVMSDGANTYSSHYQAYGWAQDNRLLGSSSRKREMDKRTLEACSEAKDNEVVVYTIAYGDLDSNTTTMLRNCATMAANAYTPKSTEEMKQVFKEIAAALNVVRLSK